MIAVTNASDSPRFCAYVWPHCMPQPRLIAVRGTPATGGTPLTGPSRGLSPDSRLSPCTPLRRHSLQGKNPKMSPVPGMRVKE